MPFRLFLSGPKSAIEERLPGFGKRLEKGQISSLQKITRTRAAYRNWLTITLLCGVLLASRRSSRITRLMISLRSIKVTLVTRAGKEVRCPIIDVLPSVEVFAMSEYDHPAIEWDKVSSVVDCGAHVGSFSLWVTEKSPCTVLAIEPNPKTFAMLRWNVNRLADRITLRRLAIAGTSGNRTLYDIGYSPSASLLPLDDSLGSFSVEAITLDMLIELSGFPTVDVLKLDVEGAEQEIFRTVKDETLRMIRVIFIECHSDLGTDVGLIERRLADAGMHVTREDRHAGTLLSSIVAWRGRRSFDGMAE